MGCGCGGRKNPDVREAARQAAAKERRARLDAAQKAISNGDIRVARRAALR